MKGKMKFKNYQKKINKLNHLLRNINRTFFTFFFLQKFIHSKFLKGNQIKSKMKHYNNTNK